MKKIYKTQNIPIAIYNINNISKSAKDKVYAQKEQDKLIEADKKKDNTGKYKNHKREKIVCNQKEVEGYKRYVYEREEYYNKPLQKLQHNLQVISLKDVKYGGNHLEKIFAKNIRNDRALYHPRILRFKKYATLVLETIFEKLSEYYPDVKDNIAKEKELYPKLLKEFETWLIKYSNYDLTQKSEKS